MYIFGVKSIIDKASKYYVMSEDSASVGDLVSFDTNDGEEFARIEVVSYASDNRFQEILLYMVKGETVYPVNRPFFAGRGRDSDAGTGTP